MIASLSHWLQIYLVNGKIPPRRGTWGNGGMPAGVFRCTDGELMLVVGNDGQFQRTCAVLGEPELASDKRFVKNNDRVVHGKRCHEPDLRPVLRGAGIREQQRRVQIAGQRNPAAAAPAAAGGLSFGGNPQRTALALAHEAQGLRIGRIDLGTSPVPRPRGRCSRIELHHRDQSFDFKKATWRPRSLPR